MKRGYIYMWINKINDKRYIGRHFGNTDDGYIGSGVAFRKAIEKYGIENFEQIILEDNIEKNKLAEKEQYYLDNYDAYNNRQYYNCSPHAGGGWDHVNSNTTLQSMNAKRFKTLWETHPHPKGFLGKKHSKESMKKTKDGWDLWANESLKKPVVRFTLDDKKIDEFESISEAAKYVNGSPSNIKYTIEGKFKKAYGYKWKYKNDCI